MKDNTNPVRVARFFRGLTLDDLSKICGVQGPQISRLERGLYVSPRAERAVYEALGLSSEKKK